MIDTSSLILIPAGVFTLGEPECPADHGLCHPWHTAEDVAVPAF